MDLSNRNTQQAAAPAPSASNHAPRKKFRPNSDTKAGRIITVLFAGAVAVILIAGIIMLTASQNGGEKKLVDTSKLQAVFLNTGQVYFGNITEMNSKYLVINNIYYLQTAKTTMVELTAVHQTSH
jgi:hypothetical protein